MLAQVGGVLSALSQSDLRPTKLFFYTKTRHGTFGDRTGEGHLCCCVENTSPQRETTQLGDTYTFLEG